MISKTKIMLTIFIACSASVTAQAMYRLSFLPKYFIPTITRLCLDENQHHRANLMVATKHNLRPYIGYFHSQRRLTFHQNNPQVQEDFMVEVSCEVVCDDPIKKEDEQSAQLIDQLMNGDDTTSFKSIRKEFTQLSSLRQHYPDLFQLIDRDVTYKEAETLIKQLKQLSQEEKLPEQFNTAFEKNTQKIAKMSWASWYSYLYKMCGKF